MPLLTIPTPTIVHHMAALDDQTAPPNSLQAIKACLDAGAVIIEIDATALGEADYLLVHDDVLESETSGQGPVGASTPDRVRDLKIKHKQELTGHPVALLSDVVKLFQEHSSSSGLQIDFKNVIPFTEEEPLTRLIDLVRPLGERVIVSSGADWQLRKLRKLAPWLMLGFDVMYYIDRQTEGSPRDPRALPRNLGAYGYYDDHPLALERHWSTADYLQDRCESLIGLVPDVSVFYIEHILLAQSLRDGFSWGERLHQSGIKLDAWTIDVTNQTAVENAKRLQEAGCDFFTTNTPRALGQVLNIK